MSTIAMPYSVVWTGDAGNSGTDVFESLCDAQRKFGSLKFDASIKSVELREGAEIKQSHSRGAHISSKRSAGALGDCHSSDYNATPTSKRVKVPPREKTLTMSEIPAACKGVPIMLGIDEAGRGPVLGPMTYGCAYWPVAMNEELSAKGFDDSKALTEAKREELYHKVMEHSAQVGWVLRVLHASEISAKMLRRTPYSLNAMSHDAAIEMVRAVQKLGLDVAQVFVDTVGDPTSYEEYLTRAFSGKVQFTVRKKADALFKVVSAASIVAKCVRDASMATWTWLEPGISPSMDMGCGYPSDEKTKAWLRKHSDPVFGFPDIVRFSWAPAKKLMDEVCTPCEWEPDEDDEAASSLKIDSMFSRKAKEPHSGPRCPYFEKRGLRHCSDII